MISLPPESAHGVLFKRIIDDTHEMLLSMGVDFVNKPVYDVTLNVSTYSTMSHWDESNHHDEMNTGRSLYLSRDCVYGFSGKLRKRYTHSV